MTFNVLPRVFDWPLLSSYPEQCNEGADVYRKEINQMSRHKRFELDQHALLKSSKNKFAILISKRIYARIRC